MRTQRRRDENAHDIHLPKASRQQLKPDSKPKPSKPSQPSQAKPKPKPTQPLSTKSTNQPQPQSEGKGLKVREALASLHNQSQSHTQIQTQTQTQTQTQNQAFKTRKPQTSTLQALRPKTPAAQIGAAGRAHAAALNRMRPIGSGMKIEEREKPRPKVVRSISVREDEVHAGGGAVERAYSPAKRRSAKSQAMYEAAFGGARGMEFDIPPPFEDDPPSPRFGTFGGDDFPFDL